MLTKLVLISRPRRWWEFFREQVPLEDPQWEYEGTYHLGESFFQLVEILSRNAPEKFYACATEYEWDNRLIQSRSTE